MADEGMSVKLATRVLHVSESGYYAWRSRRPSLRCLRHAWLTETITAIRTASHGSYGILRVHAELKLGYGVPVSRGTVLLLMQRVTVQRAMRRMVIEASSFRLTVRGPTPHSVQRHSLHFRVR